MTVEYIGQHPKLVYALMTVRSIGKEGEYDTFTPTIVNITVHNWCDFEEVDKQLKINSDFIKWLSEYQPDPNYKFYKFITKSN